MWACACFVVGRDDLLGGVFPFFPARTPLFFFGMLYCAHKQVNKLLHRGPHKKSQNTPFKSWTRTIRALCSLRCKLQILLLLSEQTRPWWFDLSCRTLHLIETTLAYFFSFKRIHMRLQQLLLLLDIVSKITV